LELRTKDRILKQVKCGRILVGGERVNEGDESEGIGLIASYSYMK
jgi:hypothetical protein